MTVSCTHKEFGQLPSGEKIHLFELKNDRGMTAYVMNYGAILTQLHVPDTKGNIENVVLGFDTLEPYLRKHPHLGGTIGRYANRIAGATFDLDGKTYRLAKNNGENCLHGGVMGFDKKLWDVADSGEYDGGKTAYVRFSLLSSDMEEGFPGNLNVIVTYELTADSALHIEYEASTDQATPLNLTNHSYFNLKGAGNGDILEHELTVMADTYTPFNDAQIPTGEIAKVEGTALDFRTPQIVGSRINDLKSGGYDHNYVLRKLDCAEQIDEQPEYRQPSVAAVVYEPTSGRRMTVRTTEPGVQIYTGNNLNGSVSGLGGSYEKYYAICLETQHFPDSMHHSNFPNVILRPGDQYSQTTEFDFGA